MNLFILLCFVSFFASCSRGGGAGTPTAKVRISFNLKKGISKIAIKKKSNTKGPSETVFTKDFNPALNPSTIGEINCIGLFVSYTAESILNTCSLKSGAQILAYEPGFVLNPHQVVGLFQNGGTYTIEVKVQNGVQFHALGFKGTGSTIGGLDCPMPILNLPDTLESYVSDPIYLGSSALINIDPTIENTASISASFYPTNIIEDCCGPTFDINSTCWDFSIWDISNWGD